MSLPKLQGPRRTNEPRKRHNAEDYRKYLSQGKCDDLDIHYEGCGSEWESEFADIANMHGKLNNNIALELVESWSKEETQRVGADVLFNRGIDNARSAFPDHSLVVVPHINKNGCFHTHVIVCTIDNHGNRLYDNGKTRQHWNKVCDKMSREHGLSTVQRTTSKQREKLSRNAHQMLRKGIIPYQYQIMQKADFARRVAVNINEFISLLGDLGIEARVRGEKTISYLHPSRKQPTRGRYLGLNYTKENLDEQFKANANEFNSRTKLKGSLEKILRDIHDDRGRLVGDKSRFSFHSGGHLRFEKEYLEKSAFEQPRSKQVAKESHSNSSIYDYLSGPLAFARTQSIVEYCHTQGIKLNRNRDGSFTIKGREHILIRDNEWENTKEQKGNRVGTRGSLIEFVANHKDVSLYGALAEITGNKHILALEKLLGIEERTYKEFHIPTSQRQNEKGAIDILKSLVKHFGYKSDFSQQLYRMKQVQVRTDGVVRFLLGEKARGAIEFKQDAGKKWVKKFLGKGYKGFFQQSGSSQSLKLFKNPFVFMSETGGRGKMDFKSSDNILVLGDSGLEAVDFFLANNNKIKNIDLFGFDEKSIPINQQRDFQKRGVSLSFIESGARERSKNLSLSR